MTAWNYIVLFCCLLLLAWLCWKEWRRPIRTRLAIRLLFSLLAVAALVLIAIPVYKTSAPAKTGAAILLTDGYNEDSLQQFIQHDGKGLQVYHWEQVAAIPAGIATLHVFGYGVDACNWPQLPAAKLVLHAPAAVPGVNAIHWQPQLQQGSTLAVQGTIQHTGTVKVLLSSGQLILDSVTLKEAGRTFTLHTIPRQLGRAVYTLVVVQGTDTLQQEPVAFEVTAAAKINVLVLAASPDFENRFLGNWLAQNGYQVSTRSMISKDKYSTSFLNTPKQALNRLQPSLLDSVDVCIADAAALPAISPAELQAVKEQVAEKGMGLLVKADTLAARNTFYSNGFVLTAAAAGQPQVLQLNNSSNTVTAPLLLEQPVYINAAETLHPLVRNAQQQMLAGSVLYGSGQVLLSTLSNTYSWLLAGHNGDYEAYWSLLLQQAARKKTPAEQWQVQPALPQVNEPATVLVTVGYQPQVQIQQSTLALAQDAQLPGVWKGVFRPAQPGWQTGIGTDGAPHRWYAYATNNWQSVKRGQRRLQMLQYNNKGTAGGAGETIAAATKEAVPAGVWVLVFLCSCTVLWIEKKLTGS